VRSSCSYSSSYSTSRIDQATIIQPHSLSSHLAGGICSAKKTDLILAASARRGILIPAAHFVACSCATAHKQCAIERRRCPAQRTEHSLRRGRTRCDGKVFVKVKATAHSPIGRERSAFASRVNLPCSAYTHLISLSPSPRCRKNRSALCPSSHAFQIPSSAALSSLALVLGIVTHSQSRLW